MAETGVRASGNAAAAGQVKNRLSPRLERLKSVYENARPEVYAERALLVTEAYRETQGLPPAARRARAMEKIFREGTVLIKADELIVGSKTPTPLGSPLYPEFNCRWIGEEIDTIAERVETAFHISGETKRLLKERVIPYWNGNTVYDRIVEHIPPASLEAVDEGLFFHYYLNRSIGHITVDYRKVLEIGFRGLRKQIQTVLENIAGGDDNGEEEKRRYAQAQLKVVDAVICFAHRHADLARDMASACGEPARREELEQIARICRRVPEYPAATFREALQSFWFTHLMLNLESNSYAISPGRFDQYIFPYYEQDLAVGRIDAARAQELVNCLWIKFAELTVVKEGGTARASNTYADFQNLNVGGLTADGSDGVNAISYMCLLAQMDLRLPQPQLSCLISSKSPRAFLLKACDLARMGTGMPAFYNADELVVALMDKGKSLVDARTGGINGCVEITGQGNDCMASSGYVNLPKALELTLNNGASLTSGRQWGPKTGPADRIGSMEDLWEAFTTQVRSAVALKVRYDAGARAAFAETCPVLCTSLLVNDCLSDATDYHDGGARYDLPMMCGVGTGTVADSLAAIEHFVFGQKRVSLAELVQALRDNFEGQPELHRLVAKKAPKFGNDDERADRQGVRLVKTFVRILKSFSDARGTPYAANMIPTTTHLPFGDRTAASPDGRLRGAPLAEGISPVQGQDLAGPTAVVNTMGKIDHAATAGTLLNMKFSPATLAGDLGLRKFAALIRTYFDLGGHHMQFNVVSRQTLLKAQADPASYRSLLIRVAGYSDYFVMLSKDVQNEVISRTEHGI
jgi:formate C-acetyltransferase